MKVGIILDNNVSKAQVHPFEIIAESEKDIDFVVFIGDKNKGNTSSITLRKKFMSHRKEALHGLLSPLFAAKRLSGNKIPRLDYYVFSLSSYLQGFDVVYTQDVTRSLYTAASLKESNGYKIILRWWENIPYKRLFSRKDAFIAEKCLGKVDLFLPATRMAAEALAVEGIDREKIFHIYPGIDTDRFTPTEKTEAFRAAFGIPDKKTAVLFTGRLVPHKGIFTILNAAKHLETLSLLDRFVFVIVGSGGQRQLMEKMAEEMGLLASFLFLGQVPYERIQDVYRACDIFTLPSIMKENIQEQFGLVLAEAMACGKPTVGTTVGAIPEVIADCGALVPPGDFKALAAALNKLAEDPKLRKELGRKGRERAERFFSSKRNSKEFLKAFRMFGQGTRGL